MLLNTDKPRRPRHAHDTYFTPPAFVQQGLALVPGPPATILDPGAGEGVWGRAARARWPEVHIIGVELRGVPQPAEYDEWHTGPVAEVAPSLPRVDLVIGNPPFGQGAAEEFVRLALGGLNFGGLVVFLLRLAFLESQGRANGLFREHPPEVVSVCASRPRFYGDGTGATPFAFFRWRLDHAGQPALHWSVGA
jgi:hypothetical protein